LQHCQCLPTPKYPGAISYWSVNQNCWVNRIWRPEEKLQLEDQHGAGVIKANGRQKFLGKEHSFSKN